MSGFNVITTGATMNWGTTTNVWVTGAVGTSIYSRYIAPRSWDQYTVQGKIKDAQEYIDFLKDSRERLREIIG